MALMEKKRYQGKRYQKRRYEEQGGYLEERYQKKRNNQGRRYRRQEYRKKRQRTGLFVFIGLVILTLGGLVYYGPDLMSRSGSGVVERVEEPTVAEAPEVAKEETTTTEETTTEETTTEASEEEPAPTAPSDPTMYLSVPKLGVYNAVVAEGDGGLEIGAMHMPGTGFPWQSGANTYIAGHRLGFPGTGSDHIFYNLPSLAPGDAVSLRDSNGHTYNYQVSELLQVLPTDLSVLNSVGDDVVSLQTCIENFGDFATLGPDWNVRLIARAVRV